MSAFDLENKCKARDYPPAEPYYFYACDLESGHTTDHFDNDTGRSW